MTTAIEPKAPAVTEPVDALKIADRCDRCAAQAIVRWNKGGTLLDFCMHHSDTYGADLLATGFSVVEDVRSSINSEPSPSANAI